MQKTRCYDLYIPSLWHHRNLIKQYTLRLLIEQYRGTYLSLIWTVAKPLMMLSIYTFVFAGVFRARWPSLEAVGLGSVLSFGLAIFTGIILYGVFADVFAVAPGLVADNPNYVKKITFPLEILPVAHLLNSVSHCLIAAILMVTLKWLVTGLFSGRILLFPWALLNLSMFTLGAAYVMATLGVYVRDVRQMVGTVLSALLFLSPVFYPVSRIPDPVEKLLWMNPLLPLLEFGRATLLETEPLLLSHGLIGLLVGMGAWWIGAAWFDTARKGFSDVL